MGYDFSEGCRGALTQARNEAVAQQASALEPAHLVLGVIKTLNTTDLARLLASPDQFGRLCTAFASTPAKAPATASDIMYTEAAKEVLAGALHARKAGRPVLPVHVLIGVHSPRKAVGDEATTASSAADALASFGLTHERLQAIAGEITAEVA